MADTAIIVTALILERPLCARCIAAKATSTEAEADAALTSIAMRLDLRRRDPERCRGCGEIGRAFWLDAPRR